MKHTPGPWEHTRTGAFVRAIAEPHKNICEVFLSDPQGRGWTALANARLIAAAPELLRACINMAFVLQSLPTDFDVLEDAEDAIAKALGTEADHD